jgi:DNA-binding transcriptional MocR family regulator
MPHSWTGQIATLTGPKYLRIVRAIGEAVRQGSLAPGNQLPPQRDLAEQLGVTVGTVARAYQMAAEEGWIGSHVGLGTFVLGDDSPGGGRTGLVDLTMNRPVDRPIRERVMRELRARAQDREALELLLYSRGESGKDADAAARWLSRAGRPVDPGEVLVTAGGQHALFLALLALCSPGDAVLTEAFVYPGVRNAAEALGLRMVGVESDGHGVDPDHLRHALRTTKARVACFTPVLANPVAVTWTADRLDEVAALAREEKLQVVEDDIYRALHDEAPLSLNSRLPESVLVSSISKALTAGLRVGAVTAPEPLLRRLRVRAAASVVMVSPLMTAAATSLITAEDLEDMLASHRDRVARRHRIAREILPDGWIESPPLGLHLWLRAPHAWSGRAYVDALRRAGTLVTHGSAFALDPAQGEDTLRVSLGGHLPEEDFARALNTLLEVADVPPQMSGPVV